MEVLSLLGSPEVLQDLPVAVRDGTVLRVNVVLPTGGRGGFPVLMSVHPYGKDNLPIRPGRRWRVSAQYRDPAAGQPGAVLVADRVGGAKNPPWWAAQGYAVANCDLRGGGTSGGEASLPADTEVTGPMALRLLVEAHGAADINLFAGVEEWHGRTYVGFEGSYGFGRDRITTGWLKASLRELDQRALRAPGAYCPPVPAVSRSRAGRSSPWMSHWARLPPCSGKENGCGW